MADEDVDWGAAAELLSRTFDPASNAEVVVPTAKVSDQQCQRVNAVGYVVRRITLIPSISAETDLGSSGQPRKHLPPEDTSEFRDFAIRYGRSFQRIPELIDHCPHQVDVENLAYGRRTHVGSCQQTHATRRCSGGDLLERFPQLRVVRVRKGNKAGLSQAHGGRSSEYVAGAKSNVGWKIQGVGLGMDRCHDPYSIRG
jgi:hypothetical protein